MFIEQMIEFDLTESGSPGRTYSYTGAYLGGGGIGPWPPLWVARIV